MEIMEKIEELILVPVAVIENAEDAVPLANALINAQLPLVEITFRTAAAAESIAILRSKFPSMVVGAGTVLTIDHVKNAVKAGAQFIVTPGFNPTVVDYCVKKNISICPGLNAPSFIEWGLERGLNHFKFYPADLSGGPQMLRTLSGPYPGVKFMPTGGINNQTLVEYLKLDNVFACGGSWIVKKDLISSKNFEEITKRTKEALAVIKTQVK
ncbi:MAG: bifunctional 4-hydroxy-2-oxoglutarate aldolase/2-dehydro-3-deoxy-phosphogluconate aldolase [Promethearchaeota archaeon]|nr:MAG: bifunctional 4-hydroxy-2-oxoglutarate aldolase/2-dehydro-3-deoxy-phosphogluconate aldolase [Candidatus Lokiarchaeota archaeon]